MINDNMLYSVALGLAGSTLVIPSAIAFGSTTGTITGQDTATSGEFGSRIAVTTSVTNNLVKYVGVKSSTVASSLPINVSGLWTSTTNGSLMIGVLMPSILQTSAFDLDIEYWITVGR